MDNIASAFAIGAVNPLGITPTFGVPIFSQFAAGNHWLIQDTDAKHRICNFVPAQSDELLVRSSHDISRKIGDQALYSFFDFDSSLIIMEKDELRLELRERWRKIRQSAMLAHRVACFLGDRELMSVTARHAYRKLAKRRSSEAADAWLGNVVLRHLRDLIAETLGNSIEIDVLEIVDVRYERNRLDILVPSSLSAMSELELERLVPEAASLAGIGKAANTISSIADRGEGQTRPGRRYDSAVPDDELGERILGAFRTNPAEVAVPVARAIIERQFPQTPLARSWQSLLTVRDFNVETLRSVGSWICDHPWTPGAGPFWNYLLDSSKLNMAVLDLVLYWLGLKAARREKRRMNGLLANYAVSREDLVEVLLSWISASKSAGTIDLLCELVRATEHKARVGQFAISWIRENDLHPGVGRLWRALLTSLQGSRSSIISEAVSWIERNPNHVGVPTALEGLLSQADRADINLSEFALRWLKSSDRHTGSRRVWDALIRLDPDRTVHELASWLSSSLDRNDTPEIMIPLLGRSQVSDWVSDAARDWLNRNSEDARSAELWSAVLAAKAEHGSVQAAEEWLARHRSCMLCSWYRG